VSNKYFYIFVTDTECLAERQRSNAILDGWILEDQPTMPTGRPAI
jgi:hypothetical protein